MGEIVKQAFKDIKSFVLFMFVILIVVSILGSIPMGPNSAKAIQLGTTERILFVVLAFFILGVTGFRSFILQPKGPEPPKNKEYSDLLSSAEQKSREIIPLQNIIAERQIANCRVVIVNDDIVNSRTDILVSSDDNYLQAKGGVAKALVDSGGPDVKTELTRRRQHKLQHGDIAVTTGGRTGAIAIIHPAIIDLDLNLYPDPPLIGTVVRRSLRCAISLGAKSIAFPILGGGTASKTLRPWESIKAIIAEILNVLENSQTSGDGNLVYIALYVFDRSDIEEDIELLFRDTSPI